MDLRPYQERAIDSLRQGVRSGLRRQLLVCPTGGGKTVIAAEMIRRSVSLGKRVAFMVPRRELVGQSTDKLGRFGIEAGVVMADDPRRNDACLVQVCTVQTLARRIGRLPPADLIVFDEAHHVSSASCRRILEEYPQAVVIGLTATPWRSDRRGLADVFEGVVVAATPRELMDSGALVGYDAFAYYSPDLTGVRSVGGDYHQGTLEVVCNTPTVVGSVVGEYVRHAWGRSAIVFAVTVAHSRALVEAFEAAGASAAHIDYETPRGERERLLAGFASGEIGVISSVGILTEGFDVPRAEVGILARPTKSLSLYLQMVGRVLRPSPATGKSRALIHDHAGNILRHGFPEDERDYTLKTTPKRDVDLNTCPLCRFVFGRVRPDGTCPNCHELIRDPGDGEAEPRRRRLRERDGERLDRAAIERMRQQRAAAGVRRELTDQQLRRAARATREEKAAEFLRLRLVASDRGFQKGWVGHQYRETFGHWPRFRDGELDGIAPAERPFFPPPPRRFNAP